jgi:hypothetical protein
LVVNLGVIFAKEFAWDHKRKTALPAEPEALKKD